MLGGFIGIHEIAIGYPAETICAMMFGFLWHGMDDHHHVLTMAHIKGNCMHVCVYIYIIITYVYIYTSHKISPRHPHDNILWCNLEFCHGRLKFKNHGVCLFLAWSALSCCLMLLRPHLSLPQLGRIARIGEWSSIYSGWCPYIIIFIYPW